MKYNRDHLIASFLLPFWGFIAMLVSGDVRKYYLPVFLFFLFYGFTFVIADFGDGHDHFEAFVQFDSMTWMEFFRIVKDVLLLRSNRYGDLYVLTSNFLISRITTSAAVYFFVHSFFYGMISLKGLRLFTKNIDVKSNIYVHGFFILLVFSATIAKIQYVRFFFATWMFVVGAYMVFIEKSKKGLPYMLGSLAVHFSFIIPLVLIPIYRYTRKSLLIWLTVALVSIGFSKVLRNYSSNIVDVSSSISSTSGKLGSNAKAYVGNEKYIEQRENRFNDRRWYTGYTKYLSNSYIVLVLLIGFNAFIFNKLKNKRILYLLTLSLFFLSLSQFGASFASVGERFQQVFIIVTSVFFLQYFYFVNNAFMRRLSILVLFPGLLYVVMALREMAFTGNIIAFFGNPLLLFFSESVSLLSVFGSGN